MKITSKELPLVLFAACLVGCFGFCGLGAILRPKKPAPATTAISVPASTPTPAKSIFATPVPKTPAPSPTPRPSPSPSPEWRTVQTWTGGHKQNTETFTITSREWRVRWQLTASDPQYAAFHGWVYHEDGRSLDSFDGDEVGRILESRMRGAGRYYLALNVANASYAVTVEELR